MKNDNPLEGDATSGDYWTYEMKNAAGHRKTSNGEPIEKSSNKHKTEVGGSAPVRILC
jgi:hypothetical protein